MDLLKSIEVFREVCKQKSFSQAANQLNLVPSAVSRQISELEKYLEVRLLHRTTRSISLTEDGKQYLQKMDAISQSIRELKPHSGDDQINEGHIRLTAAPVFGSAFFADVLPAYLQQYPNVSISATLVNREINLIEEGYDLALRVGELKDSGMVARIVGRFALSVVASPAYVELHGSPSHPKELSGHNCIINTLTKSPRRWGFREGGRKVSVKVEGRYEANDDLLLRSLVCAGLGIGMLPHCIIDTQIREGHLIPMLEGFVPEPLPISVVYPSRHHLSPAKQALIRHLVESAEQGIFAPKEQL